MFIKPYKKLTHRGFTLIELTIVMAITAIISVMIVSFTTLISAQVNKNDLRADFMEQVLTLRTDLQTEFAKVDGNLQDKNGNEVTVYNFTIDTAEKKLNIENTSFSFAWNDYEYIDEMEVSSNGNVVKITLSNEKLNETQSFVLISKTNNTFVETQG